MIKHTKLLFYISATILFITCFFDFMHCNVTISKMKKLKFGKVSYLTFNGLFLTICALIGCIYNEIKELLKIENNKIQKENKKDTLTEQNKKKREQFIKKAISTIFSIALCMETVIFLMFWTIYAVNKKNFYEAEELINFKILHEFTNLAMHMFPLIVLLIIFIIEDYYVAEKKTIFFIALYSMFYYGIVCLSGIVYKTPVYLFTKDYTYLNYIFLIAIGFCLFVISHFSYSMINKKLKNIK
ncbi:hypothetical protein NUSPORA_01602 [Nucleospora cyclopteri]